MADWIEKGGIYLAVTVLIGKSGHGSGIFLAVSFYNKAYIRL